LASGIYARAEKIEADLALARYEPHPIRAQARWLQAREVSLDELINLQTATLVAGDLGEGGQLSARLEMLAQRLEATPPIGNPSAPGPAPVESITDVIEQNMQRLEAALSNLTEEPAHAPH
jgi:hypothetical protein